MTNDPARNDDQNAADEATDASRGGWQQLTQRAEDEKRLDEGKKDAETPGTSPAPDVDLLADSLSSLGDTLMGRDSDETGEDPRTR